jgi:hypothetical protein
MMKIVKKIASRFQSEETGQALIIVLTLLLLGSLTITPVLSHIGTAVKTSRVYEDKAGEFYAADAGVEDAIWQIKYDRLAVILDNPAYDVYDFDTVWTYDLDEPVNNLTANVSVQNVWIPKNVEPLDPVVARDIIESNKLMVAGTAPPSETYYQIKINFYPAEGEEEALMVDSLGIWLPYGFSYAGGCNLEVDIGTDNYTESVTDHAGGQAVAWEFDPPVAFTCFPGVSTLEEPMTTDITFDFTANQTGTTPATISWMETSGVSDVPLSWDIDTRVFKITSVAGDTEIEAYSSKCELRKMGAAIAGDYRAVGNSLMTDDESPWHVRDNLLDESDAEVDDIPESADVVAAFLYWSGWIEEGALGQIYSLNDFTTTDNWTPGNSWHHESGLFRGDDANDVGRYLTMTNSLDLSSYPLGHVVITWDQWEGPGNLNSDDKLQYEYSANGGLDWSYPYTAFSNDIGDTPVSYVTAPIPDEYLESGDFKFRFRLNDFNGGDQNCYIDNFAIGEVEYVADTDCVFKINSNQVYLDAQGDPKQGAQPLTAGNAQTFPNPWESGYAGFSYACNRDVTKLVKAYSDLGDGDNHTGNGEYAVGDVQASPDHHLSYAGWSLIVVYSSPETAGHQLYLYDDLAFNPGNGTNLDFDGDSEPGGTITNFVVPDPPEDLEQYPNAAKLTVFVGEGDNWFAGDYLSFNETNLSDGFSTNNVWNGKSVGMTDGVDIDTFYITWASGLLESGDTTAQLDLPSQEAWNLVYIILSLRSETVTGGTTHYMIRSS